MEKLPTFSDFPPQAFQKGDDSDDAEFYALPRLVTHIDDAAIAALTDFYRQQLPAGGVLLDLMSSWVSHLPAEVTYAEVIGHGMNDDELAANPRLARQFVLDLNREPRLPVPESSIDAVLICVSIQYLQQPVAVLEEILRVLKPGRSLFVSFSNRCFPTKAIALWQAIGARAHGQLIKLYMERAGFTDIESHVLCDGSEGDPLTAVVGRKSRSPAVGNGSCANARQESG